MILIAIKKQGKIHVSRKDFTEMKIFGPLFAKSFYRTYLKNHLDLEL